MLCSLCGLFKGEPCTACRTYSRIGWVLRTHQLLEHQESEVVSALRLCSGALLDLLEVASRERTRVGPPAGTHEGGLPLAAGGQLHPSDLPGGLNPREAFERPEKEKRREKQKEKRRDRRGDRGHEKSEEGHTGREKKEKGKAKEEPEERDENRGSNPGVEETPASGSRERPDHAEVKEEVEEESEESEDWDEEEDEPVPETEGERIRREKATPLRGERVGRESERRGFVLDRDVKRNPESFGLYRGPEGGSRDRRSRSRDRRRERDASDHRRPREPDHPPRHHGGKGGGKKGKTSSKGKGGTGRKKNKGQKHKRRGRDWGSQFR